MVLETKKVGNWGRRGPPLILLQLWEFHVKWAPSTSSMCTQVHMATQTIMTTLPTEASENEVMEAQTAQYQLYAGPRISWPSCHLWVNFPESSLSCFCP